MSLSQSKATVNRLRLSKTKRKFNKTWLNCTYNREKLARQIKQYRNISPIVQLDQAFCLTSSMFRCYLLCFFWRNVIQMYGSLRTRMWFVVRVVCIYNGQDVSFCSRLHKEEAKSWVGYHYTEKPVRQVPYKALENFPKALYGTTEGTYSARVFRPVIPLMIEGNSPFG